MGKLEALWIKRAHRGPMDAKTTATAVPGKGLAGSANNSRTRQVTIIEREVWDRLMRETRSDLPPFARRADLMISGIALAHSRGRLLRVGSSLLRIGGETAPCERMDEALSGLRDRMRPHWSGGAFAQVLDGGELSVGDPVQWADALTSPPKAVLLDLDDTILNDSGSVDSCWRDACARGAPECGVPPDQLLDAIRRSGDWFWSDPERHRSGRLDLRAARSEVVRLALAELGVESVDLAAHIAGVYHDRREQSLEIFPDAITTLQHFRAQGWKLALITNGNAAPQRRKIEHFGLQSFFNAIFIEGEVGFGKPDPRVYRLALDTLEVDPADTWMAGDHLEWDVAQPQKLGIYSIWVDAAAGSPTRLGTVRPDRIVRNLSELVHRP